MPQTTPKTEGLVATPHPGFAGMGLPVAVGTLAVQAWMNMGTEAMRFLWDRLQQDIKTQQAMLASTSLEEMRTIQAGFFTAAQDHYAAEARKMLDLMGKATAAGLTATAKARRYDDVPL